MTMLDGTRCPMRIATVAVLAGSWMMVACGGRLTSRPGVFDASRQEITAVGRKYHATYVKPTTPRQPEALIVFFTGDAGWLGVSGAVFDHLAESGYPLVGFSSRELLKPIKQSGHRVSIAATADRDAEALAHAKRDLGLPESTPVILVGNSRGASGVVIAAVQPRMQEGVAGAIAIALTRESDYLRAPDPKDRPPEIQVDDQERIQLYPALRLMGSIPFAVIQSTGDDYVPSAESRRLLGPDAPTRRLYEVQAKNHGFSGGRDVLLKDLDDALAWIEKSLPSRTAIK